jgi:Protein of unknown function (DUF2911)
MQKAILKYTFAFLVTATIAFAQSPPSQANVSIGGKTLAIKYFAPSVRGRKIFSPGGVISQDPTYPVWRAGANEATAFHTDADLDIGGLRVPKGNYTLWVSIKDPEAWELIINKQTGQWGTEYDQKQDLARVDLKQEKTSAPVETFKIDLQPTALVMEWENTKLSTDIKPTS